jgi:hypothetical protein
MASFIVKPLDVFCFDVLTSNVSFIRVPKTEKCDVTASNGTLQSANSRRGSHDVILYIDNILQETYHSNTNNNMAADKRNDGRVTRVQIQGRAITAFA